MNVAVLKYFALSCAGAAFAVAIVHKNEDIEGVVDFLAKLHNHHFASLLMVNACYMVAFAVYLGLHALLLGGPVAALQNNGLPEKLVNFFSSKFVFLGLVFEVPFEDILYWLVWFAIVGLFKALIWSAQVKLEHYTATASTAAPFVRGIALILLTVVANTLLLLFIAPALFEDGWAAAALLLYDLVCVYLEALSPLHKYALQVLDQFPSTQEAAERLGYLTTHLEVVADVGLHVATLVYLLLVWRMCGIAYFVKDIVLTMHIHNALTQLRRRWRAYTTLRSLHSSLHTVFPDADADDPQTRDLCSICLKQLENSKKLPCGHCLHATCIADMVRRQGHRAETHIIRCPLCRKCVDVRSGELLPGEPDSQQNRAAAAAAHPGVQAAAPPPIRSFFRFSTVEWPRWIPIPGFSVELLQRADPASALVQPGVADAIPADVQAIVDNISAMFPDVPRQLVLQNVLRVRNPHVTIDNILNARPPFDEQSLTAYAMQVSEVPGHSAGGDETGAAAEAAAAAAHSAEPAAPSEAGHRQAELPRSTMSRYQDQSERAASDDAKESPAAQPTEAAEEPASPQTPVDERELRRRRALEAVERRWASGSL